MTHIEADCFRSNSHWRGTASITPPGAGCTLTYPYSSSWRTQDNKGVYGGGWWGVRASIEVDRPGTYGFCGDGSP